MNKEQILNAYQWRFACKEFLADKKISESDLDFLLEIIRLSPSSFGLQPFQVFVLNDQKILNELLPFIWGGQKQIPTASDFVLFTTRNDLRYDSQYVNYMNTEIRQLPPEMLEFYKPLIQKFQESDFDLLSDNHSLTSWCGKQAYIALGNLMTGAAQIGIDSCPIEGFAIAPVKDILTKHRIIDPNLLDPCVFCALGYRKEEPSRPKTRQPREQLVHIIK